MGRSFTLCETIGMQCNCNLDAASRLAVIPLPRMDNALIVAMRRRCCAEVKLHDCIPPSITFEVFSILLDASGAFVQPT